MVLRGRRKYPELNLLMSESDHNAFSGCSVARPSTTTQRKYAGPVPGLPEWIREEVGGLEGGFRSGKRMGKGEGREGNKVSKPSSPAAYQPNNQPHPPQLHFPNPTQVPSTGNRGPPHSVGQNRVPVARFCLLAPTPPPPHTLLDCAGPGHKPQHIPPQSTPHHSNPGPPARHSPKPSPHGSVSVLLLFLVNSPYFDFSTLLLLYILLHLHMYIHYYSHSIHNIWVLFRGLIG